MNVLSLPCPACGATRVVELGGTAETALYLCLACDEEFESPGG